MRISKLFILALFVMGLRADIVSDYLHKDYKKICTFSNIEQYKWNEKALSIIGESCVRIDSLYLLPFIVNKLKHTEYGRKNSIYFLTIVMQKKLLYSFVFDGFSLKAFSFPATDYILSKIFMFVKNGKYTKEGDTYVMYDEKSSKTYKLYKSGDKMYIDTYQNGTLIKRRWFR